MEIKNKRKIYCYQCLHFQRTEIPSDDNYGNTMFTVLDEGWCPIQLNVVSDSFSCENGITKLDILNKTAINLNVNIEDFLN